MTTSDESYACVLHAHFFSCDLKNPRASRDARPKQKKASLRLPCSDYQRHQIHLCNLHSSTPCKRICMYVCHALVNANVCVYTYAYACMHVYRREPTWRGPALRQSCIKVRSACDLRCRVNNFTRRQASSVYLHWHDNTGMTLSPLFLCHACLPASHQANSLQASSLFRPDPIPILDSMGLARALDPSPAKVLGARSFVRHCRLSFANCWSFANRWRLRNCWRLRLRNCWRHANSNC